MQTTGICTVHALVFAHQPLQAIVILDFVESDEVPEVPFRFRHGLVSVSESGFAELVSVPLQAGDLAALQPMHVVVSTSLQTS